MVNNSERMLTLDVETTGLDAASGHRIIEIGCYEIVGGHVTGKFYHQYINPKRNIPREVVRIHGITDDIVRDKPEFHEIVGEFTAFVGNDRLIIHNAAFDTRFINHHLREIGRAELDMTRVIDTLTMAKRKFPGSPANLDALCRRFNIDLRARKLHGALIDSKLLARVYIEMEYGKQDLLFGNNLGNDHFGSEITSAAVRCMDRDPVMHEPTKEEKDAHKRFCDSSQI